MSYWNTHKSVVLATLLFSFLLTSCSDPLPPPKETVAFTGGIMGTTYHITVVAAMNDDVSTTMAESIEGALKHVDGKMSTYKDDSELSVLNRMAGEAYIPVSAEVFSMLQLALEVNRETEGAFDITVGPLVNRWGFGPDDKQEPPSEEELASLKALCGPDAITLDALTQSVQKVSDGVYCDLSGIAKGYAVDLVASVLEAKGFMNYMVEVGGEVRTAGRNSVGIPWKIAIEKPVEEGRVLQEVVGLSDISLATSGNYRNFYEVDGKRYSHTISPSTGKPVDHSLASVSVLHPRCALADAYATALMVLGPETGLAVAERLALPVMFVSHSDDGTFETRQTESFRAYIVD